MNPYVTLGELAAVLILLPLSRPWSVQHLRRFANRLVARAEPDAVRRWAAGARPGRFAFAYGHGAAWGAGTFAIALLVARFPFTVPGVIATVCAAFYGADWGAQFWSAREARIRALAEDVPPSGAGSVAPVAEEEARQPVTPPPVGLFTGLGILGAVFAFVLALATYRDNLKSPDNAPLAAESSPSPAPATLPRIPERLPAETPPPIVGAATPSPDSKPSAPTYQNVDFSAVIQQMNDEANNLMPYSLPLPVPEEQYQDLQGKFQKMATRYFPDLAVRGSQLNREFVTRYKQRHADSPTFFDQPDWPVRLAIECIDLLTQGKSTAEEEARAAEQ